MKIPTKSVGNRFYIHGLIHESLKYSISREYKELVRSKLQDKRVICEDGFCSWIPNAISFRETEYFNLGNISLLSKLKIFTRILLNGKKQVIYNPTSVRDKLFRTYPLEPEGMNDLIAKTCGGTLEEPGGRLPLRIRRYLYEAKQSLDYSEKYDLNELHIVVGCAHERPLEYLLQNRKILNHLEPYI